MCCHFVEGGLLEQAEDLVYYLVDIRGVVEFFQLFVEFVFHLLLTLSDILSIASLVLFSSCDCRLVLSEELFAD